MKSYPVYTRGGDRGKTSLVSGKRVGKDDLQVAAYGDADETCAWVGLLRQRVESEKAKKELIFVQHKLFCAAAILANPAYDRTKASEREKITDEDISRLEKWIDAYESQLKPLKHFILPGGGEVAATAHLVRCVCRRAERSVVALHRKQPQPAELLKFFNRLSDYFFVLARALSQKEEELIWDDKFK